MIGKDSHNGSKPVTAGPPSFSGSGSRKVTPRHNLLGACCSVRETKKREVEGEEAE